MSILIENPNMELYEEEKQAFPTNRVLELSDPEFCQEWEGRGLYDDMKATCFYLFTEEEVAGVEEEENLPWDTCFKRIRIEE